MKLWSDKRQNGATFNSWTGDKSLAWGVTIPHTIANSYIGDMSMRTTTAAADRVAGNKTSKYTKLVKTCHYILIAIEMCGVSN